MIDFGEQNLSPEEMENVQAALQLSMVSFDGFESCMLETLPGRTDFFLAPYNNLSLALH